MQVVTATLTCLSTGAKKDQLAQVEVNEDGASSFVLSGAMPPLVGGHHPVSSLCRPHPPTGIVFIVTGRAKFTQVGNGTAHPPTHRPPLLPP